MNPPSLSALLIEDEPLCRADFRQILRSFPDVHLAGEAESLPAAEKMLRSKSVDLLFLDISVGDSNSLDWLERLPHPPLIIALTAHGQYAVRGFSLNLVDYILKPVEETRLRAALEKARYRKTTEPLRPGRVTFFAERNGKKTTIEVTDILRAEAMGNYVLLHTPQGKAIQRATFKHVHAKLPSPLFFKTSRGRVVAVSTVQAWHRNTEGKLLLDLTDQTTVPVSQSHAPEVLKILEARQVA